VDPGILVRCANPGLDRRGPGRLDHCLARLPPPAPAQRHEIQLRLQRLARAARAHRVRAAHGESLERGKIAGADKQQEYYGFIVQECGRLSSLIENVLDFSRIEQGRKQYELEPPMSPRW